MRRALESKKKKNMFGIFFFQNVKVDKHVTIIMEIVSVSFNFEKAGDIKHVVKNHYQPRSRPVAAIIVSKEIIGNKAKSHENA